MARGKRRKRHNRKPTLKPPKTPSPPPVREPTIPDQPPQRLLLPESDGESPPPSESSSDMETTRSPPVQSPPVSEPDLDQVMSGTENQHAPLTIGGNPDPLAPNRPKRKRGQAGHETQEDPQPNAMNRGKYSGLFTSPTTGRHSPTTPSPMGLQTPSLGLAVQSPETGENPIVPPVRKRKNEPNPVVTGFFGDNPLLDLNTEMKEGWKSLEKAKAIAIPFRAAYSDEHKLNIAKKITAAIGQALGGVSPSVLAPEQASNAVSTARTFRPPWCYLITNLRDDDIDQLVSMAFISNQHFGVQILPFTPPHLGYVASIRGLSWSKSKDHGKVVHLITETLETNVDAKDFIESFIAGKHDQIPSEHVNRGLAFEWILNTVRAYLHVLGDDPSSTETLWRWFISPPTSNPQHIATWTNYLETIPFHRVEAGWGKPFHIDRCVGCKSTNHPTPDCPFPGQFPQLDETNPPPQTRPPARGRGRGGNDRGRGGRGNRGREYSFRNTGATV